MLIPRSGYQTRQVLLFVPPEGFPQKCCFFIHGSLTTSINSASTKFLGQIVGKSLSTSKRLINKMLTTTINQNLSSIDTSPIRGDFKVWIYRNYLAPSLFYHLAVNNVSFTNQEITIKSTVIPHNNTLLNYNVFEKK